MLSIAAVVIVLTLIGQCEVLIGGFRFQLLGRRSLSSNRTAFTTPSTEIDADVGLPNTHRRATVQRMGNSMDSLSGMSNVGTETIAKASKQLAFQPLRIIISGAPASGKGTQCEKIVSQYGVVHLSTGEMLRAAMRGNTPLGKEVRVYMEQSKLVPDDIMIRVVHEHLARQDCVSKGWVLDGYPRTRRQAEDLLSSGIKPDVFILLEVPQNVLLDRAVGRRSDPVTGKVYHLTHNPPESTEIAQRLIQRHDDTIERTKLRIRDYQTHTTAVRTYFEDVLVTINGSTSREDITKNIFTALNHVRSARVSKRLD